VFFGANKERTAADLEEYRDITDDVEESDFVPYACHYSPTTLLTKNGELLQIIKIGNFDFEAIDEDSLNLRDGLRKTILDHIPDNRYALWFNTIRRVRDIYPGGDYPDEYSANIHEQWKSQHNWDRVYVNELYVTVVRECQSASLTDIEGILRCFIPNQEKNNRMRYLDVAHKELNHAVDSMLESLKPYGSQRLNMVERESILHSEPLEFLSKLINLTESPMPVPEIDLSIYLTSGEITFAYNAMEVRSLEGKRRFGALLTLKQYKEASADAIDQFLQIPAEFIVTQCFDFINNDKALEEYTQQQHLYRVSGDANLSNISELNDFIESDRGKATDYGEHQITIFLLAESVAKLETNIAKAVSGLSRRGIISIREDIFFEECYWAQLPANFEFLRRLKPIPTSRVGGFTNLGLHPTGKSKQNHWGEAVALVPTAFKTPYFFNFHTGDNGHTLIVGADASNAHILNFLLSESQKYQPNFYIFDSFDTSKELIQSLKGRFIAVNNDPEVSLKFNPFCLEGKKDDRDFLYDWVSMLMGERLMDLDAHRTLLRASIDQLYNQTELPKRLSALRSMIASQNQELASALDRWCEGGEYGYLFDNEVDYIEHFDAKMGFGFSQFREDPVRLLPITNYLLYRISDTLNGEPTIFILQEAVRLLENPVIGPYVDEWLLSLRERNAMAILVEEDTNYLSESMLTDTILAEISTQLYFPNEDPDATYIKTLGFSETEFMYLTMMEEEKHHLLIRRGCESVVLAIQPLANANEEDQHVNFASEGA
jgi:type IV secretion system protein VirB4